jgi:hypothetical protein
LQAVVDFEKRKLDRLLSEITKCKRVIARLDKAIISIVKANKKPHV